MGKGPGDIRVGELIFMRWGLNYEGWLGRWSIRNASLLRLAFMVNSRSCLPRHVDFLLIEGYFIGVNLSII